MAAKVVGDSGLIRNTENISSTVPQSFAGGIAGSLREFVHALASGSTPQGECHDNIKSLAMVFAAVKSASEGKRVKVEW